MTDYQRQKIRELFPTHSGSEIGRIIGLSRSYINAEAKKMGLSHTFETWERLKKMRTTLAAKARTKESYARAMATRKRTYNREMFRMLGGQKKETNITISILSHKCRRRMSVLCTLYNYFRDPDINKAVVYYDSETTRNKAAEEFATSHYGIKFVEADG